MPSQQPRVVFNVFQSLPRDIRLIVWEFTLPGPRVLAVSAPRRDENRLYFLQFDNQPNPVTLSVCLESRDVALKRYRLCFGTPNVYADLAGGDILYFGRSWTGFDLWQWLDPRICEIDNFVKRKKLSDAVVADLRCVTHVGLSPPTWWPYTYSPIFGSGDLRKDLGSFSSLKRLYLVHGGTEPGNPSLIPGHLVIEDSPIQSDFELLSLKSPSLQIYSLEYRMEFYRRILRLKEDLLRGENTSADDVMMRRMPEIQTCIANRIEDGHKDN